MQSIYTVQQKFVLKKSNLHHLASDIFAIAGLVFFCSDLISHNAQVSFVHFLGVTFVFAIFQKSG